MWIGALDNREKLVPLLGAPNNDADGCQPGSGGAEAEFGDEERAQDQASEVTMQIFRPVVRLRWNTSHLWFWDHMRDIWYGFRNIVRWTPVIWLQHH